MRMNYDLLFKIEDQPITIQRDTFGKLEAFRDSEKFFELDGVNSQSEKIRLSSIINTLSDRLIADLRANRSKRWVMVQFQYALQKMDSKDTVVHAYFRRYLQVLSAILKLKTPDDFLVHYLGTADFRYMEAEDQE
jgi:hypothetical protein